MSNLMEFEEISAKMRLERNRGAGQSISSLVKGRPRLCRKATVMPSEAGYARKRDSIGEGPSGVA
jgi:hypothetical protein